MRIGNIIFWSIIFCLAGLFLTRLWRGAGLILDTTFYSVWLSVLGVCLYSAILADWRMLYRNRTGTRSLFMRRKQLAAFASQNASKGYFLATTWLFRASVVLFAQAIVMILVKGLIRHWPDASLFHNLVPPQD